MLNLFALTLLCASWLVPLHIPPWISWHNEVLAFASALCFAAALLKRRKNQHEAFIAVPYSALVVAVFGGVVLFQFSSGLISYSGDALVVLFYLSLCVCMVLVGFDFARSGCSEVEQNKSWLIFDWFAAVLLLGASISAVIALVQALDVWGETTLISRMQTLRRPGANLGQPNQLATLLLMGMVSLAYLYERARVGAASAMLLFALMILGIAATESRTGLLGFSVLMCWWFVRRRTVRFSVPTGVVLAGASGLICLFWLWPAFLTFLQAGGSTGGDVVQVNTTAGTRLVVWPQLIEAMWQRPWFGWGLRELSHAHNAVLHHYDKSEPFTYAHNIVLDLAVGVGLPLAALFLLGAFVWAWRRMSATKALLPWYCTAMLIPLAVHSMLEFPFSYAYFLVPAMFCLGALDGVLMPHRYVRFGWWPAASGFFLMTLAMGWSVVEYIAIEEDFRVARFEASHIGKTASDYERPAIHMLTQLDALNLGTRMVPAPDMTLKSIEFSRKVAMRHPSTAAQNRYALTLALNGSPDEAIRQLKVMRAMYGEASYLRIKANWAELANTRYPQLKAINMP